MRIGIAYPENWVSPGRCSELKISRLRADENVSVIGASAAVINAERVVDRNVATGGSAMAG